VRNAYKILVRKREGKRPLGIPRRSWEIRMDFKEVGWEGVAWMLLADNRGQRRAVANAVINLQVP
jgi:hypothetical protein